MSLLFLPLLDAMWLEALSEVAMEVVFETNLGALSAVSHELRSVYATTARLSMASDSTELSARENFSHIVKR